MCKGFRGGKIPLNAAFEKGNDYYEYDIIKTCLEKWGKNMNRINQDWSLNRG